MILARLPPAPGVEPRSRLLCLHHVGGDRNSLKLLGAPGSSSGVEVWVVGYPGRMKSEQLLGTVEALAEGVFAAMHSSGASWSDLPLTVFGHSLGGIVAFELCRRLSARTSIGLRALVVSAAKSPLRLTEANATLGAKANHLLPDRALVDYIDSIGGLPPGVSKLFLDMKLPAIRGDYRCFETYALLLGGPGGGPGGGTAACADAGGGAGPEAGQEGERLVLPRLASLTLSEAEARACPRDECETGGSGSSSGSGRARSTSGHTDSLSAASSASNSPLRQVIDSGSNSSGPSSGLSLSPSLSPSPSLDLSPSPSPINSPTRQSTAAASSSVNSNSNNSNNSNSSNNSSSGGGGLPARLDCDILSLGASRDAVASPEDMAGWAIHTTRAARFRHVAFEGGHFYFSEPQCKEGFVEAVLAVARV